MFASASALLLSFRDRNFVVIGLHVESHSDFGHTIAVMKGDKCVMAPESTHTWLQLPQQDQSLSRFLS